jgi:mono/diheme cytochrome c family protein
MKKIITLFSVLVFVSSCSKSPEDRGTTYMPDMTYSVANEAYSESDITPDGRSMIVQVEGSIPRGKMPYHYGTTEAEAIRAGEELVDPYSETAATKMRGQEVYSQFCATCHGDTGEGDGPVVMKKFPAPPALKSKRVKEFSKGRIFHVITKGFQGMPSHASQVLEKDRWYVAQYIKELQSK